MKLFASILAFVFISFSMDSTYGSISNDVNLTGKIVSFDAKSVNLKSGNRIFTLPKSQLNYPAYKVGSEIEVKMTRKELGELKSRSATKMRKSK